ncbi:Peptidyl-prolyl cis-trans isomerase [Pseudoalteromonas luteoviolacea B = ATCC 29581]|nr:Peptidyl-prolyl cis-trans isomerase [Pseudoalteromonas luteoviolacea B = ATCC 29581]
MTIKSLAVLLAITVAGSAVAAKSPYEIISTAPQSDWRVVENDNVLRLTLPTGHVYVELNPALAPSHADNMKKLAREGFYQGLSVYRFVEGFVAQGGDMEDKKEPKTAKKAIKAEFALETKAPLAITKMPYSDGYAAVTGFHNGFAVAQNQMGTKTWQVHCTGVFAMARGDGPDTGGTEFYVALAPQRYLDLNITVFGRVLEGMEHVQKLDRVASETGSFNPITDVVVLSDVKHQDPSHFRVMDTKSSSFKQLITARANRPEAWFLAKPNFVDVCSVGVPTERIVEN